MILWGYLAYVRLARDSLQDLKNDGREMFFLPSVYRRSIFFFIFLFRSLVAFREYSLIGSNKFQHHIRIAFMLFSNIFSEKT